MRYIILLVSLFVGFNSLSAQETISIVNQEIVPRGTRYWANIKTTSLAKGDKIKIRAQVLKDKKDFEFCVTMFPGNQLLFVDVEAKHLAYEFTAPATGMYAFWCKGKKSGKFKLTIDYDGLPGSLEMLKNKVGVVVDRIDTLWGSKMQKQHLADSITLVPRVKRILYQSKTMSEIVYNHSFAVGAEASQWATVVLPYPNRDTYQEIEPIALNYTLTVDAATYNALQGQISNVVSAGVDVGVGKAISKLGSLKEADEGMTFVSNMALTYDKVSTAQSVIESSAELADVLQEQETDSAQQSQEIEAYMFKGGELESITLQDHGQADALQSDVKTKENKDFSLPGIGDIANYAASKITPKIKDKIDMEIYVHDSLLVQQYTGFATGSVPLDFKKDGIVYYFKLKNRQKALDVKNLLSVYRFGNLICEYKYKVKTYKDVVYYERMRKPIYTERMVKYGVKSQSKDLIFKDMMTSSHVRSKKQTIPQPSL